MFSILCIFSVFLSSYLEEIIGFRKMKNTKKNVKKLNDFIIEYDSYKNYNNNDQNEFQ